MCEREGVWHISLLAIPSPPSGSWDVRLMDPKRSRSPDRLHTWLPEAEWLRQAGQDRHYAGMSAEMLRATMRNTTARSDGMFLWMPEALRGRRFRQVLRRSASTVWIWDDESDSEDERRDVGESAGPDEADGSRDVGQSADLDEEDGSRDVGESGAAEHAATGPTVGGGDSAIAGAGGAATEAAVATAAAVEDASAGEAAAGEAAAAEADAGDSEHTAAAEAVAAEAGDDEAAAATEQDEKDAADQGLEESQF